MDHYVFTNNLVGDGYGLTEIPAKSPRRFSHLTSQLTLGDKVSLSLDWPDVKTLFLDHRDRLPQ